MYPLTGVTSYPCSTNEIILYSLYIDEPKRPKTIYRDSPSYSPNEIKGSPELELEPEPTALIASSYQPMSRPVKTSKREYRPVLTGNDVRDKIIEMIVDSFKKNIPPGICYISYPPIC